MTPADFHQVLTTGIWAVLIAAGPILLAALVMGFGIALFQALTSVQDMTLTFVPKVAVIFGMLILTLPFIYTTMSNYADEIFTLIMTDGY